MIRITNEEFKRLAAFILANYGIYLKIEKQTMVMGRLTPLLQKLNFTSFTDYLEYVLADKTGLASATLIEKISTNHTFFMREAEHFHFFKETVLPYMAGTVRDKDLRIWSAGCSTGEEPYTLAMIVDECFGLRKREWDTKILATDISNQVLERATKGIYEADAIASLPPKWRSAYFKKLPGAKVEVADAIKQEMIFRRFNLMDQTFPFKRRFHVIFCRNVMIYFDKETKAELVRKFYEYTEPGGYLFIGQSETIPRDSSPYKYIMPAVYRKE